MRDVVRETLAVLQHKEDAQMEHSQYHHFLSHAREGSKAVVMPMGDCDHIGCFTDQVKLTHALV
jgi:phage gp45-like